MTGVRELMQRAKDQGLLPQNAQWPQEDSRGWPVVLLTALGSWLAVLPLLGAVRMVFSEILLKENSPLLYVFALGLLTVSIVIVRQPRVGVLVEQLCSTPLILGLCCLAWALVRDYRVANAALGMAAVCLVVAWLTPVHWLRTLLGALLGFFLTFAIALLNGESFLRDLRWTHWNWWLHVHLGLAVWLGVLCLISRRPTMPGGNLLTSLTDGWCEQILLTLALLSGVSVLMDGAIPGGRFAALIGASVGQADPINGLRNVISALLAAGAATVLAVQWPGLRQKPMLGLGVGALLMVLSGCAPNLGGACLCIAVLAVTRRWQLAALACAVAVWIIGSFYYMIGLSLTHKAFLLIAIGAGLGMLAWLARSRDAAAVAPVGTGGHKGMQLLGIGLTCAATVLIVNVAIVDKERTIRNGEVVFVRLGPTDPRSLVQGDYMRLDFALPRPGSAGQDPWRRSSPTVLLRPDPRMPSTYTLHLPLAGETRQAGEIEVPLAAKNGHWIFVTDAWHFKEGDAEKYARARYGEFRILRNGSAMLVGMADEELQPIR